MMLFLYLSWFILRWVLNDMNEEHIGASSVAERNTCGDNHLLPFSRDFFLFYKITNNIGNLSHISETTDRNWNTAERKGKFCKCALVGGHHNNRLVWFET